MGMLLSRSMVIVPKNNSYHFKEEFDVEINSKNCSQTRIVGKTMDDDIISLKRGECHKHIQAFITADKCNEFLIPEFMKYKLLEEFVMFLSENL